MAEPRIARAVLEIVVDDKPVKIALGNIQDASDETAKHVKSIDQQLSVATIKEFATKAVEALKFVVTEIVELGSHGADVADVQGAFAGLSAQVGSTAAAMLGALREGTAGTISDFDLMTTANKALADGMLKSDADARTLAAGAKLLADRTGGDAKEGLDKLFKAISSGKDGQLAQLGLFVDTKRAVEQYAEAHGKLPAKLSETERATAIAEATMAALRQQLVDAGPPSLDFADRVGQMKAALENFRDEVAVGVAQSPVFAAALGGISEGMTQAFGGDRQALVKMIVGLIEDLAIGLTYVAEGGVMAAKGIVSGFSLVRTQVLAVITAVTAAATAIVALVDGAVQLAAKVPGGVIGLQNLSEGSRELRLQMQGATVSLAQQTAEAAKGVLGQGAFHEALDKVGNVLSTTRERMLAAKSATGELATGTDQAMTTLTTRTTQAEPILKENARKIAETFAKLHEEIAVSTKVGVEKRLTELEFQKQAEITKLGELNQLSKEKYDEAVALINEKYRLMSEAARLGSDEIRDRTVALQQELLLAQTTGTEQQVMQLEFRKQKELEGIEFLKVNYNAAYTQLAAMIQEKYGQMTAAARGHFATVEQAASAAGFKTRDELQQQAQKADETYRRMLVSGKFTEDELRKAHEAAKNAEAVLDDKVYLNKQQQGDLLVSSASGVLRSIFGKHKGAAIAAALIDTYAAVAKALSAYPWPINLAPAAAALAAGMAQVSQIRGQSGEGFAAGTPGLDFQNFGGVSAQLLHGNEAVIPQGSGHLLAGEIAAAMPGAGADSDLGARFDRLAAALADQPKAIARAMRQVIAVTS